MPAHKKRPVSFEITRRVSQQKMIIGCQQLSSSLPWFSVWVEFCHTGGRRFAIRFAIQVAIRFAIQVAIRVAIQVTIRVAIRVADGHRARPCQAQRQTS